MSILRRQVKDLMLRKPRLDQAWLVKNREQCCRQMMKAHAGTAHA